MNTFRPVDYGHVEPVPGTVAVLMVEDSPSDALLFHESLVEHGVKPQLFVATDGDEAILLLNQIDSTLIPCPELIVLDLNLPKVNGFDVLKRIRRSPHCGDKPVIMLSSSDTAREREEAARLGVTRYIRKPSHLQEFLEIGKQIKTVLALERD